MPDEFLTLHPNPPIPTAGDNVDLLFWAQACAINNRAYFNQIQRFKDAQ